VDLVSHFDLASHVVRRITRRFHPSASTRVPAAKIMAIGSIAMGIMVAGCGPRDGIERVRLSGRITFDGQVLEVGQIRFVPQAGTKGPVTIERFRDGTYTTDTTNGVPVGSHRVEILAHTLENYDKWPVGPGVPPLPQILPPQFNDQSTLTIELPSGTKKRVHDFELSSKKL
jgi:hypothetical protein